jgi:flagella basal body P-ring formation protein FlgA
MTRSSPWRERWTTRRLGGTLPRTGAKRVMRILGALLAFTAVAAADPLPEIVRDRIGAALPAGLGVAKVHLTPVLEKLDVTPDQVVVELPRDVRAGRSSFKVTVGRRTAVYVPVSIGKLVDVAVARRTLAVGAVISAGDIDVQPRALEMIVPAPGNLLVGATVTREITAGMPVAQRDVALARPLARGTQVTVEMRRGAVRIRGTATLEAAARPGEPAQARLAHTRTIVRGTLSATSTLIVGE